MLELLPADWKELLHSSIEKPYFAQLQVEVDRAYAEKQIYPPKSKLFEALHLCSVENTKVIIIGQDPYHGAGQAMGLSFSVPPGVKIPPSLRNIFKELMEDMNMNYPMYGDLRPWAKQGVLLLNSILTVEHKKAGSHAHIGWQEFTDDIIIKIAQHKSQLVFLLWGKFAQTKAELINPIQHCILEAAHPSPLARNKFFGNQHFSKTNQYLIEHNKQTIEWNLN